MKVPVLFSYAYMRRASVEHIEYVLGDDRLELLMDSGAFTAFNSGDEIKLDDYMQFVGRWGDRLCGYMALDKLQDPVATEANLRTMIGAGLRPIPIHVFGDTQQRMDELFALSSWVACGGFRRPHRGAAPRSYVKEKMRWAAGRDVHWLGYTDLSMIKRFHPYSVDCASFASGRMYGRMCVYVGNGRMVVLSMRQWLTRADVGVNHKRLRTLILGLGLDPELMDRESSWRWGRKPGGGRVHAVQNVNTRSWVKYAIELRATVGTRMFLAIAPENRLDVDEIRAVMDFFAPNVMSAVPATP